ncbi:TadE/TadG family type IV pilus assembly protein [Methylobacterium nigriterrae]|uniref:TadE/TadG family type IV pilus assembly protein n=1 Tax=Methylobacterium nigriterrae TaxID=3127512 RepID=UPI0030136584
MTFSRDERGGIAVILAIALPVILVGIGGSIETSRAIAYRQRLSSAVELACTQAQAYVNAHKPQDVKAGDLLKTYPTEVRDIGNRNLAAKDLSASATITATNPNDINVHVDGTGRLTLAFGRILNKSDMAFTDSRDCAVKSTVVALTESTSAPQLLISESFERPSHSVNYNSWDVLGGPKNGNSWNGWTTQNAGIEINGLRELASNSIRFGDFFAELDSDCNTAANRGVTGCHSNSAMSRYLDLTPGTYQIRYWYIARQRDTARPGQVICGSKDSDVSWYTKDGQTNRIELFVEKKGSYTFDYANMVDVCVQADAWTERVINFTVKNSSEYRITWRAAGREDTYGGLIDYLRICRNSCPN